MTAIIAAHAAQPGHLSTLLATFARDAVQNAHRRISFLRSRKALNELSDRLLEDVGLSRSAIEAAARNAADRLA